MHKFDDATPEIRWAVDSFHISDRVLFSYGWMLCGDDLVKELQMEITYVDGGIEVLSAETGLDRPDVVEKMPTVPRNSGFLFYSSIAGRPIDSVRLVVETPEGGMRIARKLDSIINGLAGGGGRVSAAHLAHTLARKTWYHLRRLEFGVILTKIKRVLPSLWTVRAEKDQVMSLLEGCAPNAALIIDHRLGGGANMFRERLIERLTGEGRTVVLLTFEPPSLRHHLDVHYPDGRSLNRCVEQNIWFALAASRCFSEVYFNNCVSFPSPESIPEMLVHLVKVAGTRLTVFLHDYYTVCPSHFLLNEHGVYCGLPKVEKCRECLPRIRDGLVNLYRSRDIDDWRRRWLDCLKVAHDVVCFSPSGRDILLSAYPELADRSIEIRPHVIEEHMQGGFAFPAGEGPLRIAVVGSINTHKGSQIVLDLAGRIAERGEAARICVIGTLVKSETPVALEETGPYKREDLPAIIRERGIHLALMPSILPETFSFVTHELIAMGVPVVTFDMGAQAEAARRAANCRVVPMLATDALLDQILEFGQQLRQQHLAAEHQTNS